MRAWQAWAVTRGVSPKDWNKPQPLVSRIELLRRAGAKDEEIRTYTNDWQKVFLDQRTTEDGE